MKTEILKKIVELANGFGLEGEYIKFDGKLFGENSVLYNSLVIPLLLRRAVEGVNNAGKYEIYLYIDYVLLSSIDHPLTEDKDWDYSDYPKTEYLTSQEQAIEACLTELLEV
jgi:hypothetical protein